MRSDGEKSITLVPMNADFQIHDEYYEKVLLEGKS